MVAALELRLGRVGGIADLATLATAIWHMLANVCQPTGRRTGPGARFLRAPILALATLLFAAAMGWLWLAAALSWQGMTNSPAASTIASCPECGE